MYHVMCRVSGGVTGTRQSLLKENGTVAEFPDESSAATRADELNRKMNHEHSVAEFQYWAISEDDLVKSRNWIAANL
jgi:hypothetical protein